jgi:hypothetical protein
VTCTYGIEKRFRVSFKLLSKDLTVETTTGEVSPLLYVHTEGQLRGTRRSFTRTTGHWKANFRLENRSPLCIQVKSLRASMQVGLPGFSLAEGRKGVLKRERDLAEMYMPIMGVWSNWILIIHCSIVSEAKNSKSQ